MAPDVVCGFKWLLIRFAALLVLTPIGGFAFLRFSDYLEKTWKSGNRRKKWIAMCWLFLTIATLGGFLQ